MGQDRGVFGILDSGSTGDKSWQECDPEFNPYSLTLPNNTQTGQREPVDEVSTGDEALVSRDSNYTQTRTEMGTKDAPDAYQPHMVT